MVADLIREMTDMGFFDNLGEKLANTSKDVAAKAKEVADVTKMKMDISSQESRLKTAYGEIGKLFCENAPEELAPEYVPFMQTVTEAKTEIERLKLEIQKLKGTASCEACGAEVAADARFCPVCGAKVEKPVEVVEEDGEEDIVDVEPIVVEEPAEAEEPEEEVQE